MPKIADIEYTPNPNAKRFVLKEPLTRGPARSYDAPEEAKDDALAAELFGIPHVTGVYYVDRFLTVSQDGAVPWNELERQLAVPIRAAKTADEAAPVASKAGGEVNVSAEDRAKLEQINEILDKQVRPALLMDGGGLEILALAGHRLTIHYQGACGTCPSSISGTLRGIENLLRTIEPEIEVVAA